MNFLFYQVYITETQIFTGVHHIGAPYFYANSCNVFDVKRYLRNIVRVIRWYKKRLLRGK